MIKNNECNPESLTSVEIFLHRLMTKLDSYQRLQDKLTSKEYVCLTGNKLIFHLNCLPTYIQHVEALDPTTNSYTPTIEAFLACLEANPIPDRGLFELICRCPQPSKQNTSVELEKMRSFVSNFLKDLHDRLRSTQLRTPTHLEKRDIIFPFTKMTACVDKLFAEDAQYMVVRVDLSYPTTQAEGKPNNVEVELESIKSDWNRLYSQICDNELFRGLDGYISKIEYVAEKGWCIRIMLFFDEMNCMLDEVLLARDIKAFWNFNVTICSGKR